MLQLASAEVPRLQSMRIKEKAGQEEKGGATDVKEAIPGLRTTQRV